jgi:NAD(P)H-dependent flavin oxidoreductase YrpB (nitropropane dioxygenase family)
MLAGVDFVLMGAGIPSEIPALLTALANHDPGILTVTVEGAVTGERHTVGINPRQLFGDDLPQLTRPRFLAIVSTHVLAAYLARDPVTRPDGFVLETPVAGGHSAPPRGHLTLSDAGEPVYGDRDRLDLAKTAKIGLPFWLAGGYATPDQVTAARDAGAVGVQVGSVFALCRESGMDPSLRRKLLSQALDENLAVFNHPRASPTSFPFKVAELPETVANDAVYKARTRVCDLGFLRSVVRGPDGSIGYRCSAEPVDMFIRKGGSEGDTFERRCLCNGLVSTVGFGQRRPSGYTEAPLVTLGQDLGFLPTLVSVVGDDYTAGDVIEYLLSGKASDRRGGDPDGGLP